MDLDIETSTRGEVSMNVPTIEKLCGFFRIRQTYENGEYPTPGLPYLI